MISPRHLHFCRSRRRPCTCICERSYLSMNSNCCRSLNLPCSMPSKNYSSYANFHSDSHLASAIEGSCRGCAIQGSLRSSKRCFASLLGSDSLPTGPRPRANAESWPGCLLTQSQFCRSEGASRPPRMRRRTSCPSYCAMELELTSPDRSCAWTHKIAISLNAMLCPD